MELHLLKYFGYEAMHALFFTLIHSLWQAIVLAAIAAIILILTKRSAAALRYNLLTGTFLMFIVLVSITFFYEINSNLHSGPIVSIATNHAFAGTIANINKGTGFTEKIIVLFKSGENIIVLTWSLIIVFKCINLVTGIRSIYMLKRNQVSEAGEYWNNCMKELAEKIGVTQPVVLLKSAIAEMPMVIGHLKPIILFPAAALTALAPTEIEAILLHELAHIRRKDYLINMVQNLAEIIFFFNPAILWISSLIKNERENCCDDIAIAQVQNKKQFIHALVSFQEYNIAAKYTASFSGRRSHLLNRIKRIITNNNKTLNIMEKIFLASGIIITGFIAVTFSQQRQPSFVNTNALVRTVESYVSENKKDTIPVTEANGNELKSVINTSIDGKQYRLIEVDGKVTELYVDNSKIPGDKISEYKNIIDKLHQQMKADKAKQIEQMKAQQELLTAQSEAMQKNELAMNEDMQKQAEQLELQVEQFEIKQKELTPETEKMKTQLENQAEEIESQSKELLVQAETLSQKELINAQQMLKEKDKLMKAEMDKHVDQMKFQKETFNKQAELLKQKALMMKDEVEKQSEVLKQKSLIMKEQMQNQAELMKQKALLMKDQIEKQTQQLKDQHEYLMQQLKEKLKDSIDQNEPTEPK